MDWFLLVPVFVIGVFLFIIWNSISPIHFIQQLCGDRQKRKDQWRAQQEALIKEEEETLKVLKK
ncbi:hypothetical protein [Terasakiella pusilla]|jgi:predicted secreted protein|uniref:hypothetical protein n=1 Tax=Terasakiella pusilla TaxID=64973 RepID=UPI003AA8543E